jgi:hypothetical protein
MARRAVVVGQPDVEEHDLQQVRSVVESLALVVVGLAQESVELRDPLR